MKLNQLLLATTFIGTLAIPAFAADDDSIAALKQQIDALDQKVKVLERKRELDQDDAAAAALKKPLVKLDSSGFSFSSADTNFVIGLHGLLQFDSRTYIDQPGLKSKGSNFLLRKARPILTGTVFHDFDFNFTPDFGGGSPVIYDAYINYRYNPAFQLEVGKFKSPVGLELLQSDTWLFFNERTLANNLVPNRDYGVELHGDLFGGVASYAAGVFDGVPDYSTPTSNQDFDNNVAFAGRVFFQPLKKSSIDALQGLGVGVGGSYQNDQSSVSGLTSGYVTDGQQTFFSYASGVVANGRQWRISPQGYYYYGPFGLLGEYVVSDQKVTAPGSSADLRNTAWEVSLGWVLTGETASYNGLTPKHPFDFSKGQWGAWQLVARYADLDVDDAAFPTFASTGSASEAKAWSVGLNWYLNKNIRANVSYSHTKFDDIKGAPSAVTRQDENAIFTRVQLAF